MTLLSKPTIDDIEAHGYKVLTKSEYERMKKRLDVLERLGDREMTPEELQAIQEQANNATIRGMKVEVSEEGIVFVGKLVADPVETLRDALDEVERLRGALEEVKSVFDDSEISDMDYALESYKIVCKALEGETK